MSTLICVRINGWVNNREAGDLRRHRAHYDVIVMQVSGAGTCHKIYQPVSDRQNSLGIIQSLCWHPHTISHRDQYKSPICCVYLGLYLIRTLCAEFHLTAYEYFMMTPSNGNIFRVTGHLWSPENSPHKGQWSGALMFNLFCAWINRWVNNGEARDLRRRRAHYDFIVMPYVYSTVN